jgi:hypothetical protein
MSGSLLIRPALEPEEGLRGYVSLLAHRNRSPTFFRPMLDSRPLITMAIPELASLTTERPQALLARGSHVARVGPRPGGVRFGDVVLPRRVVRSSQRMVCPRCIEQDGRSRCVWELHAYDVCQRHGLCLVDTCSACGEALSWSYASSELCACGFPFAKLARKRARTSRRRLCGLLATSMRRSLGSGHVGAGDSQALPIDWTLLLLEFITEVLIPRFAELHGGAVAKRFRAARWALTVSMLEDVHYRDYLRDAVFMQASSNPLRLLAALRPGRHAEWRLSRFDPCWDEVSFHRSLWDLRRVDGLGVAKRTAGNSTAPLRDALGVAASETPRVAIHLVSRQGPPPSWLVDDTDDTAGASPHARVA